LVLILLGQRGGHFAVAVELLLVELGGHRILDLVDMAKGALRDIARRAALARHRMAHSARLFARDVATGIGAAAGGNIHTEAAGPHAFAIAPALAGGMRATMHAAAGGLVLILVLGLALIEALVPSQILALGLVLIGIRRRHLRGILRLVPTGIHLVLRLRERRHCQGDAADDGKRRHKIFRLHFRTSLHL
jgi:hypothetical protein